MTKFSKIILCLICGLLIFASGCKQNTPPAEGVNETLPPVSSPDSSPEDTPAMAKSIKLALITSDLDVEIDYDYFNVWDGVITFSEANNLNYSYYRPIEMTDEEIAKQFKYAIEDGATTIICMGDVFAPTVNAMQAQYPDTQFIIFNATAQSIGTLNPNTHSVMFLQEQGGYLAGYGAVKDGFKKIAYLGDHPSEAFTAYAYGYIQGANDAAKELNTSVEITIGYISDFESKDAAISGIDSWYKNGIELIMISADDDFVASCAKTAVNNMGYLIGTNNDQSYLGANLDYNPFMTSTIKGLREAVDTTLDRLLSGDWDAQLGGKTAYFGLQNGNYIYMPEYEATWLFKGFTLEEYHSLKAKIANGEVVIDGQNLPTVDETLVTLNITE